MALTGKEWAAILVPVVTLIIAIVTTVYNILERKRFYKAEKEKLATEIAKTILSNSDFLNDKYNLYNETLGQVGVIVNHMFNLVSYISITKPNKQMCDLSVKIDMQLIEETLSKIANLIRSKSSLISYDIHKNITREFCINVRKSYKSISASVSGSNENFQKDGENELRNTINEIIQLCEKVNVLLRDDMQNTLEQLHSTGIMNKNIK